MRMYPENSSVRSFLNVTTDKVYANKEWEWGYRETDVLDGYDPYSNSKSCSELVTHSYLQSFFSDSRVAVSTARAGNVIGGGDFSQDRIIPDCVRSLLDGKTVIVRNPESIRPYQHVLDPLFAYLVIIQNQYEDKKQEGCYNVGPNEDSCVTTGKLADLFCRAWGEEAEWTSIQNQGPHEADFLKLDCSKLKKTFDWKPRWNITASIEKTVEWTKEWNRHPELGGDCMKRRSESFWRRSNFMFEGLSEQGAREKILETVEEYYQKYHSGKKSFNMAALYIMRPEYMTQKN